MVRVNKTKDKILDVAEVLFAEKGFNDTSLRAITSEAKVNLASVNYHFGDKKTLVRAVIDRYLEAFMPAVGDELVQLNRQDSYSMKEVFESLRLPLLRLDEIHANGASRFMLLIGRGYTDVQGHLRWFITTRYSDVLNLFTESIKKANPNLSSSDLFWRLHFTLGTCVFTMGSSQALAEIAFNDYGQTVDSNVLIDQLLPYLAAGVAAD
ncbi:TetR family transcriptional regulator [Vibrio sp. JC009]|uniref:TetR/AcrR family transcriptional regulator n=1 Tax=Vibrio sp. JC009 TaxID=2912314 RepID=UPI0023AE87B0|nr:TetR/AcrR family transcriptional regulator [Vibrio sp. JC009]WED22991.1 TetR family transcriptional regulator [Vibrio sp. JC009]